MKWKRKRKERRKGKGRKKKEGKILRSFDLSDPLQMQKGRKFQCI